MSQNPNSPFPEDFKNLADVEPVDTSIDVPDVPHLSIDFAQNLSGSEVGDVLSSLDSALEDPKNRENWKLACAAVLTEEEKFPRHGADLGYLQIVTNNFNPDQKTWRAAAIAHLRRMRADGIYPSDVEPSFGLARDAKSIDALMSLARFAFKMRCFQEAMGEALVFMARRATGKKLTAHLPTQI